MNSDFHSVYQLGQRVTQLQTAVLIAVLGPALIGTVWFSPMVVWLIIFGLVLIVTAIKKPLWVITGLAWYLPFEPFLLKWVGDALYVYVRYTPEIAIYLLAGVLIARTIFLREKLIKTPVDGPFLCLVIATALSVLVNWLPAFTAILGIRQIFRFILLFFIALNFTKSAKFIKILVGGLVVILFVQLALGTGQKLIGERLDLLLLPTERHTLGEVVLTAGQDQFWNYGERVFGTMGRYDQLGIFITFVILLLLASRYEGVQLPWSSRFTNILIIISLPVLAWTYSRSAWFGLILGVLVMAIYFKKDQVIKWCAIALPILIIGYATFTGLVVNRLVDSYSVSLSDRFFEAFSLERWYGEYYGLGRVYWAVQTVTTVIPTAPIFGVGPGRYGGGAVSSLYDSTVYDKLGLPFGVYGTTGIIDNNWFSLWGEIGTLGLILYFWLYFTVMYLLVIIYRNSKNAESRAWALGMVCAFMAMLLHASLGTYLEVRTIAPYLWIISGGVIAIGYKEGVIKSYENRSHS